MITTLEAHGGRVQIAHQGAQVISWVPANQTEQLFLSKTSSLDSGKAIRGGVPVIFPQFSELGPLSKHGFARNQIWQTRSTGQGNCAVFELRDTDATRALWPYPFLAELTVTLSGAALEIELAIHNTGSRDFEFTSALHSYFRVEQIRDTRISGLKGTHYQDSVTGERECLELADALTIDEQVDRIYRNAPSQLEIKQKQQRLLVQNLGFADTVIWNPWQESGAALSDLEPDGYAHMVCVEAAQITQPVQLKPNSIWRASQRMQLV
ncbi:glucose-6-phosphate 1-epimerase [Oxalobacteraceae bacterium GrIS 1.18]